MTGETPKFTGTLALENAAVDAGSHYIVVNDLALADNGKFKTTNYSLSFTTGVQYTIVQKEAELKWTAPENL